MLNPTARNFEKAVLSTYQKENPSTYKVEDEKIYKQIENLSYQLYTNSLHILPKVFDGADLLDMGCGTGEWSMTFFTMECQLYVRRYEFPCH